MSCRADSNRSLAHRKLLWSAVLLSAGVVIRPAGAQDKTASNPQLDEAFQTLAKLQLGQDLGVFNPIEVAITKAHADGQVRADLERRLIRVLKGDATDLAKQYACRQLTLVGTDASVPVLAALLSDATVSHMARYALEGIGGPAVNAALRAALDKVSGPQRLGVVISLGRLADADAVDALAALLVAQDRDLCRAAAVALGRIGTPHAAEALMNAASKVPETMGPTLVAAELEVAQRLCARHDDKTAVAVYQALQTADSTRVKAAAFRGLIRATPAEAAGMIIAGLGAKEPWKRAVAADCILTLNDPGAVEKIAAAVATLPRAGRIAALANLRHFPGPAVRAAAQNALQGNDGELCRVALATLIESATADDVPRIAQLAGTAANADVRAAAQRTLALMTAKGTNQAIQALIAQDNELGPVLVRVALARRHPDFVPVFLHAARSAHQATRLEATKALEIVATDKEFDALLDLLLRSAPGAEREAVGRAVWRVAQRAGDAAARTARLLETYRRADTKARCALLPVLGRLGGARVLAEVHAAMHSANRALRDAGYRALANWPDASVADELFTIAKSSDVASYRIWALRALARVVALPGALPPEKAFAFLQKAMALAKRTEDKELIVSRLGSVRTVESLQWLLSLLDDPELAQAAIPAVFDVAKGLSRTHPKLATEAFEKIRPLVTDPVIQQQMPRVLRDIKK